MSYAVSRGHFSLTALVFALMIFGAYGWHSASGTATEGMTISSSTQSDIANLVWLSEDTWMDFPGCDAVSVFDVRDGTAIFRGPTRASPARLAATSDFSHIVAAPSQSWGPFGFLYLVHRNPAGLDAWSAVQPVVGTSFAPLGGIAVLSDDDSILVSTASVITPNRLTPTPQLGISPVSPFKIEKYRLSEIWRDGDVWRLGPLHGELEVPGLVAQMIRPGTSDVVHAVLENDRWGVVSIDGESMMRLASDIAIPAPDNLIFRGPNKATGWIMGDVSPDGRYFLVGRGRSRHLTVADLQERTSWTLPVDDVEWNVGISFNEGWFNSGTLAIHHGSKVGVYTFLPDALLLQGSVDVSLTYVGGGGGPLASVAWTASGDGLVAADIKGESEFAVFDVDGGIRLRTRITACPLPEGGAQAPNDIITANGFVSPSATVTLIETATLTPDTTIPAPTRTSTAEVTSPTPTTSPIYLPVLLSEECTPDLEHADILLVLDASTSMLDTATTVESKMDLAIRAAQLFLTLLTEDDQVGVVWFNVESVLEQELTSDLGSARSALGRIENSEFTRIDLGLRVAREELLSDRTIPGNRSVIIILTDGKANPVPVEAALAEADAAKEAGVTLFTIGLGHEDDLDADALEAMASRPDYYYHTPHAQDLSEIYKEIHAHIPCPG
jgi:Mg-chelatase subunit ChlD